MGLDAYLIRVKKELVIDDLHYNESMNETGNIVDLVYWRKNYGLDSWMLSLYYGKGGDDEFNCKPVRFTEKDLDKLVDCIWHQKTKNLDHSNSKFIDLEEGRILFDDENRDDQEPIPIFDKIKKAFQDGYVLYYVCWW